MSSEREASFSGQFPYSPFDGQPWKLSMGLAPLDVARWIEFGPDFELQMALRAELLNQQLNSVVAFLPEAVDACFELNSVLRGHLVKYHSEYAWGDLDRMIVRSGVELKQPRDGADALSQLAFMVQEDFCILSNDDSPRLIAGLVCFPSHWMLSEKLGKSSDAIHSTVPGFQKSLATPTNAVLGRILEDRPLWRLNWTIHGSDELHSPVPKSRQKLTQLNVLQSTWLRIERQTLRRLPESRAIVFSIRTYQQLLADAVCNPDRCRRVLATLKSLPPETAAYKGLAETLPVLVQVLERQ